MSFLRTLFTALFHRKRQLNELTYNEQKEFREKMRPVIMDEKVNPALSDKKKTRKTNISNKNLSLDRNLKKGVRRNSQDRIYGLCGITMKIN